MIDDYYMDDRPGKHRKKYPEPKEPRRKRILRIIIVLVILFFVTFAMAATVYVY